MALPYTYMCTQLVLPFVHTWIGLTCRRVQDAPAMASGKSVAEFAPLSNWVV